MRARRTVSPRASQRRVLLERSVLKRLVLKRLVPKRSMLQPLTALFVALLLAFGPQLSALHFTLIGHEVCHEHGELHHADSAHGGHAADAGESTAEGSAAALHPVTQHAAADPSRVAAAAGSGAPLASPSGAVEAHEHEHCGAASNSVPSATIHVPPTEVASLLESAPSSAVGPSDQRAHASIPLLAYAPKLAPPSHPLA